MKEIRNIIREVFEEWDNGMWVHYSKIPIIKFNYKAKHRDPFGIYLFPEKFKPTNFWRTFPYKFTIRLKGNPKIFDISKQSNKELRTILERVVKAGAYFNQEDDEYGRLYAFDKTPEQGKKHTWWRMLQQEFDDNKGTFNKFFRVELGYDAIFDDTGTIMGNEVQLIVLKPNLIEVVKLENLTHSGFHMLKKMAEFIKKEFAWMGEFSEGIPKEMKNKFSNGSNLKLKVINKKTSFYVTLVSNRIGDDEVPSSYTAWFYHSLSSDSSAMAALRDDAPEKFKQWENRIKEISKNYQVKYELADIVQEVLNEDRKVPRDFDTDLGVTFGDQIGGDIIVAHSTSSSFLPKIYRDGLKIDNEKTWDSSSHDKLFFEMEPTHTHCGQNVYGWKATQKFGGDPITLYVKVKKSDLHVDQDDEDLGQDYQGNQKEYYHDVPPENIIGFRVARIDIKRDDFIEFYKMFKA